MTFVQTPFFGASIRSFTGHIGWGDSASSLDVDVCEDDTIGEVFSPSLPGSLAYFNYMGWEFGGLVQSYKKLRGEEGNALYSVRLEDPRDILNGVVLIVDHYTMGVYSVPNLYNVYGYIEANQGFGAADVNEAGMPWDKIRNAFLTLQNTTPIRIYDQSFLVDLTNLPNIPSYHRISGPGITLMDFISDICHAGACDFFFRLMQVNGNNVLKIYTISRNSNSNPDAIALFLDSLSGFNRSEIGLEFTNEVKNKFIIGGKVQKLYKQEYDDDEIEEDATIWPYFGDIAENGTYRFPEVVTAKLNGAPLEVKPLRDTNTRSLEDFTAGLAQRLHGAMTMRVKIPEIKDMLKNNKNPSWYRAATEEYLTDLNELRAVMTSQDAWLNFLLLHNDIGDKVIFTATQGLGNTDKVEIDNIHKGKFGIDGMNLIGLFNPGFINEVANNAGDVDALLAYVNETLDPSRLRNTRSDKNGRDPNNPFTLEDQIKNIYTYLRNVAERHFGIAYAVSVPMVVGKINRSESEQVTDFRGNSVTLPGNKLVTNWEPATDGGYLDNVDYQINNNGNRSSYTPVNRSEFAKAVEQRLLPIDASKFLSEDGKITAYARFSKKNARGVDYNFSQIPEDSREEYGDYVFVKCELEPQLTFFNKSTLSQPKAIVRLAGPVTDNYQDYAWQAELMKQAIISTAENNGAGLGAPDIKRVKDALDDKFPPAGFVGQDFLMEDYVQFPIMPSLIVVPLRSNVHTYGPWYVIGANGKTEFESDESLVPWNFGSYDLMNLAGLARIAEASAGQQYSTNGTLTYAGVPVVNLGDVLIAGGPYLTDINVSIGEGGATTTYHFQTWTRRFGTIPKETLEEIRKNKLMTTKQRHSLYQMKEGGTMGILRNSYGNRKPPRRGAGNTTHPLLVSEKVGPKHEYVMSPAYNAADQTYNLENKAVSALDTLFVPFSTKFVTNNTSSPRTLVDENGTVIGDVDDEIPHFEMPSGRPAGVNATGLNPFIGPHNFTLMTRDDDEWEDNLHITESGINDDGYRLHGLRMPLVGVGWGYDTNGKPVPNKTPESPSDKFAPGYRENPNLWKAGPIDIRWHNDKKIWIATSEGSVLKKGRLKQQVNFRNSGICDIYEYNSTSGRNVIVGTTYVCDYLLQSGAILYQNTNIFYMEENGRNFIVNAACGTDPVWN